jgi:hypothetical protein
MVYHPRALRFTQKRTVRYSDACDAGSRASSNPLPLGTTPAAPNTGTASPRCAARCYGSHSHASSAPEQGGRSAARARKNHTNVRRYGSCSRDFPPAQTSATQSRALHGSRIPSLPSIPSASDGLPSAAASKRRENREVARAHWSCSQPSLLHARGHRSPPLLLYRARVRRVAFRRPSYSPA